MKAILKFWREKLWTDLAAAALIANVVTAPNRRFEVDEVTMPTQMGGLIILVGFLLVIFTDALWKTMTGPRATALKQLRGKHVEHSIWLTLGVTLIGATAFELTKGNLLSKPSVTFFIVACAGLWALFSFARLGGTLVHLRRIARLDDQASQLDTPSESK
ncbi:hypothetical protein V5R04_07000 [Jonesiaceae bacterium BS-20]|uniref:Transmembrane protein n=1 Tax=Jonesiaceae bacterium BS-20 TaxID=3120821 RepID=A0AAU7E0D9_9MICO